MADESDGRYRAGAIDAKLDGIASDVREIKAMMQEIERRVRETETRLAAGNAVFAQLKKDVEDLRRRDWFGGVAVSTVFAALLGLWEFLRGRP